jgi:hypothetical protein
MYLTWRAPKEELKVDDARVVRSSEIAKSGSCKLVSVESRDGTALAAARVTPGLPFWFEDEQPLVIMEFSALSTGGAEDTKVSWTFPEGGTLEGQRVRWLVPGFREGSVKMTVKSAKSVSTATIPYFGFSTITASLNQAEHRKAFRDTLAEMLSSFPKGSDPLASWGDAWWNNIFRTIEAGKGQRLLASLFGDHFESVKKRLNPTQSRILEDVFLDVSVRDQPEENLKWLQKFFNATTDPVRQSELRFREAELCMYYLNDRKKSENLFTVLASTRGETAERAKIRLGDLALLGSDLNKATSYYADVQNRARIARSAVRTATTTCHCTAAGVYLARVTRAQPPETPRGCRECEPAWPVLRVRRKALRGAADTCRERAHSARQWPYDWMDRANELCGLGRKAANTTRQTEVSSAHAGSLR